MESHLGYVEDWLGRGCSFLRLVRPMLNLFAGQRGSRAWKRSLSEASQRPGAGLSDVVESLSRI